MHYYLIEDFDESLSFPEDCTVVALDYDAIFKLEKLGRSFVTLEDFYTSGEMRGDTDAFMKQQLLWFKDFDEFIKDVYPGAQRLDANLASIYYYWIKYCVDNIILSTKILKRFIESTKPEKISFLTKDPGPDRIEHVLSFKRAESTYSRLIEPICETEGIAFERLVLVNEGEIGKDTSFKLWHNKDRSLRQLIDEIIPYQITNLLKKVRNRCYVYIYLFKTASFFGKGAGNVLVLNDPLFIKDFLGDEQKNQYKYFFHENGSVRKYSLTDLSEKLDIDGNHWASISESIDWNVALQSLCNGKIMGWINGHCGLDVSLVLLSRFELFLREICPKIISLIPVYIKLYDKYNIDLVITSRIWTVEEHAAIAAVRYSSNTKSVYLHHGADAVEARSRTFKLVRFFDLYFVSSEEEAEHERNLLEEFHFNSTKVFSSSYFQKKYSRLMKVKYPRKKFQEENGKPIVLFIPVWCSPWASRPVEKNQPFPMEYVKWHRSLADLFSTRKDYHFIWKGFYAPNQKIDLMQEILREQKYDNISFYSNKLTSWLPVVERVLCDSPSTPFFEAIYSRLPVMGLYRPEDQRLHKNYYECFDKSLRAYSSINEGIKLVREFLDNNSEQYVVSLQETGTSGAEILDTVLSDH